MRIGIVLSNHSEKSETFFRLKIDALNKTGKKIIIFSDKNHIINNIHFVKNPILHKKSFIRIIRICIDMICAFWDGKSKETKSTIDLAKKMNMIVQVITEV